MMIRRMACLAGLVWILWSIPAQASCSGSGQYFQCPAGASISDVQNAINSASDGATITFASGSYTWTGGTINPSVTNSCLDIALLRHLYCRFQWNGHQYVRFSERQQAAPNFRLHLQPKFQQFRNLFLCRRRLQRNLRRVAGGSQYFQSVPANGGVAVFCGDSAAVNLHCYGALDHNTVVTGWEGVFLLETISDVSSASTPTTSPLGTANNLFVEDNTITITTLTNSGSGCTDGWGSAFAVDILVQHSHELPRAHTRPRRWRRAG